MSGDIYGIFGARGNGRDVLTYARLSVPAGRLVFIDDDAPADSFAGVPVVSLPAFAAMPADRRHVALAPSAGATRAKLAERLKAMGIGLWSLAAPNALIAQDVVMGEGALVGPGSIISSGVRIGRHFQMNSLCNLAHDCRIGDGVTFGPGVLCSGVVEIGDGVYVGAAACIRQGTLETPIRIGKGAVIGMGAVILGDVPAGETWVGNPGKRIS